MLLDRITKCMREEALRITEKEVTDSGQVPRKPEGLGFFRLLWYLLFYCPVITQQHLERKSTQFIFVPFSAWQYAGSDRLWAGLVTTLCDRVRRHFGAFPQSVFNVLGSPPKRDLGIDVNEWIFKKSFCIKLVVTLLVLFIGLLLLLVPVRSRSGEGEEKVSTVFGGLATVVSGSGIIMTLYKLGKSIMVSQKQKIERLVNSQKFSTQMGFMSEVKKEVELITQVVQCMEIFQRQKIRVVLHITSLELCAPDKVVGVLDAMNTLLSDRRAPFISILVVDPSIIVTCLENASSLKGMADNGYMFLNRTVTLPFSVPALGKKTKLQLLKKAVQRTEDLIDWPCRNDATRATKTGISESVKLLRDELSGQEEEEEQETQISFQPGRYIQETFYALYSEREVLHEYIPDSISQMKRIVNTIPVTVHLMMLSYIPLNNMSAKAVAAWVVLCNQWPCRLSWVLQCLEDEEQSGSKEGFCSCLLWEVFKEYSKELFSMKAGLKNLLDLDADPEIFQKFLSQDFPFRVEEARRLMRCTVNLDSSIKNKMGLLRGINNLQNDWKQTGKEGDTCRRECGKERDGCRVEVQKEKEVSYIVGIQKKEEVGGIVESEKTEKAWCEVEIQKREESGCVQKIQKREESGCLVEIQKREDECGCVVEVQKRKD
ncbi:hypothetical protein FKM82_015740 [Ascaphus truei]